jgi:hypothetical protein
LLTFNKYQSITIYRKVTIPKSIPKIATGSNDLIYSRKEK